MGTSTLIILAIIVVVVLWAIGTYNGLVSMRQRVNQAFADIDVQLRQRHDLIPTWSKPLRATRPTSAARSKKS